jgi:hypothetical protein
MASGDATRAILDFDGAIQLKSDLSQAYTNRGNAHLRLGQLGQALADFRQARAGPDRPHGAFHWSTGVTPAEVKT